MLGFAIGTATALREIELMQKTLPADDFVKWLESKRESDKERRHRELCEAIRSTSFWRFGR